VRILREASEEELHRTRLLAKQRLEEMGTAEILLFEAKERLAEANRVVKMREQGVEEAKSAFEAVERRLVKEMAVVRLCNIGK